MDRRLVIGIAAGCGAVIVCVVAALIIGGFWFGSSIKEPTDVTVDVNIPLQIRKGQGFIIFVTINETSGKAQELDSIDIEDAYLEGIAVERTDPAFRESYSIFGYQSYDFMREIPANGELVVRFYSFALRTGDFSGEMDICINGPGNCLTRPLRTVIEQ